MGNSIDTRIVELEFDNARFEEGVKTSLNTLQTLDKNLDFSKNVSSFEQLQSDLNSTNFAAAAANAGSFTNTLASGLQTAVGFIGNLRDKFNSLSTSGKVAIAALSTGITGLALSGGMSRALNIEKAQFQIEGLGIAFEDVHQSIVDAVADTAYGYDEAAKAASQFAASGVELGDNMYHALKAVSGVAAMTNDSYTNIAQIFAKIAGQGAIMGEELNQLGARGLAIAPILATYFNEVNSGAAEATESVRNSIYELTEGLEVTGEDIRAWASKRLIDFDMFAEAMFQNYGEHAAAANKTLEGSASNVRAVFSRMGEAYLTPFNQLRTKLNQGLLGDPSGMLFGTGQDGDKWRGILRQIETTVKSMSPLWTEAANLAGNTMFSVLELIGRSGVVESLGQSLTEISTGLASGLAQAGESIDVLSKGLFDGFLGVIDLVKGLGTYIAPVIDAFTSVFKIQLPNFDDFIKGLSSFKEWAASINLGEEAAARFRETLEAIFAAIKEVGETAHNVFSGLYEIISPVAESLVVISGTAIISALGFLTSKLAELGFTFENLNTFVDKATSIFDSFYTIFETGNASFDNVANGIGTIGDKFKRFFDETENFKWLGNVFKGIGDAASTLVRIIGRVNDKFVEYGITFENIGKFFSEAWGYISEFISIFSTGIPDFETFSDAIGNLGTNFGNLFKNTGSKLGNFVMHIAELLGVFAGNGLSGFKEGLNELPKLISGLLPSFASETEDLAGNLAAKFLELPKKLLSAFSKGFSEGEGTAEAAETFGTLGESVDVLDQTFGEFVSGKFSEFINSLGSGLDEAATFGEKIKTVFDTITESVGGLVDKLGEWASKLDKNDIVTIFSGIFTGGFLLGLLDAVLTIRDIAHGVKDATSFFSDLKNVLVDGLDEIIGKVADAIGAYEQKIKAQALKEVAISIGILAASLWVLSTIPVGDLLKAGAALAVVSALIIGLAAALSKISEKTDTGPLALNNLATSLLMFSGSILLMAIAVKAFSALGPDQLTYGMLGVAAAIVVLLSAAAALGKIAAKYTAEIGGLSIGLIGLSVALIVMAKACKAFSDIPLDAMGKAGLAILALLVSATVLGAVAKLGGNMVRASLGLAIFSGALIVLANAASAFSSVDISDIGKIAVAIAALSVGAIALGVAANIAKEGNLLALSAALISLSISLSIISGVVSTFSEMNPEQLSQGLLSVLGLIVGISVAMAASSMIGPSGAVGIIALAGALVVLSGVVTLLGSIPFETVQNGLLGLGGALAILLVAGAISGIPLVAKGLVTLSSSVAMLGVGVGAVGLGMMLFSTALTILASMAPVAVQTLLVALEMLLVGLVTIFFEMQVAAVAGILSVVQAIAARAPDFAEAFIAIGNAIFDVFEALLPRFGVFGADSITEFLVGLGSKIGEIVMAGVSLIAGVLLGIAASIGTIIQAAVEVAVAFINGVAEAIGNESNQAALGSALENLGASILNLLWNGITQGLPKLGMDFIDGVKNALTGGESEVTTTAQNLGQNVTDSVDKSLSGLPTTASTTVDNTMANLQGLITGLPSITGDSAEQAVGSFDLSGLGEEAGLASMEVTENFDISSLLGDISGLSSDVTDNFDLSALGKETSNSLADVSNMFASNTTAQNSAKSMGLKAVSGFDSGASSMGGKARNRAAEAVSAVNSQSGSGYNAGYSVGSNMGSGMDSGMGSWISSIAAKARQMVSEAKAAANAEAQIKSPSRVFAEIGMYLDLGLVAGMEKYKYQVENAAKDVTKAAVNSAQVRASYFSDIVDDINYNPVIRPVLDASQFRSDVRSMNGYFMQNAVLNAGYASSRQGAGYLGDSPSTGNSTVVNISLDYRAGEDANQLVRDISLALKSRNILEA